MRSSEKMEISFIKTKLRLARARRPASETTLAWTVSMTSQVCNFMEASYRLFPKWTNNLRILRTKFKCKMLVILLRWMLMSKMRQIWWLSGRRETSPGWCPATIKVFSAQSMKIERSTLWARGILKTPKLIKSILSKMTSSWMSNTYKMQQDKVGRCA